MSFLSIKFQLNFRLVRNFENLACHSPVRFERRKCQCKWISKREEVGTSSIGEGTCSSTMDMSKGVKVKGHDLDHKGQTPDGAITLRLRNAGYSLTPVCVLVSKSLRLYY